MRTEISVEALDEIADSESTASAVRDAWRGFRSLVPAGSAVHLTRGGINPSELARTYAIRWRILRDAGRACGGFEQSIAMLEREPGTVAIGAIETARYYGICFLDSELTRLVGFVYFQRVEREIWPGRPASGAAGEQ